ncbi:MAG: AAA family ATPase [Bacteroidales bacterium]|jgi:DNA sulfur modification protein DndD
MKIKKLLIENFLCYYSKKEFVFKDGLNLILGRNGEGKTKFFEALEWLFSSTEKDDLNLVSAKRMKELDNTSKFTVRVALTVEKDDEISVLEKAFDVGLFQEEPRTSNYRFVGYEDKLDGSRISVDGVKKLERLFPAQIRRFSMFKGEAELNIFDDQEALKRLIDAFSEVKYYPPFIDIADKMNKWHQDSMDKATRSNEKISREVKDIQFEIDRSLRDENKYQELLKETEKEIEKASSSLSKIEQNSERSETLKILNDRIERKKNEINSLNIRIEETYSTFLLDEKWILFGLRDIYEEFSKKIADIRKLKNLEEKKSYKSRAKEVAKIELINEAIPLPWFIPDEGTMKELLKEEICKVCNRSAPKDSEPYLFMESKLKEYINRQNKNDVLDDDGDSPLFPNEYIDRMHQFEIALTASGVNIDNLKTEIGERLEFNRCRKEDLKRLQGELDAETEEKNRIMAESTVSEYDLLSMHSNIREWTKIVSENSRSVGDYQRKLTTVREELAEKIETKNRKNAQVLPSYEMETFRILNDIKTIFTNTKERLLTEFIDTLEEKSNQFISKINLDDFTGRIRLRRSNDRISVQLINADETPIYKPNGSLEISKHIAVLLGISELASETKQESFPMLFDAPTSSFDPAKVQDFYNLLYETKKQRIIATKDFTSMKEDKSPCIDDESFDKIKRDQAYWIYRTRPFDKEDLCTIETQVEPYG